MNCSVRRSSVSSLEIDSEFGADDALKMHNRLRELRHAAGLTLQQLADRVGTTAPTVSRLEKGDRELTVKWMRRFGDALGLRPSEILEVSPKLTAQVVGRVGAGDAIHWLSVHGDTGAEDLDFSERFADLIGVRVRGDSMYPVYRDGDLLFCRPRAGVEISECLGRDCVVQTVTGESFVKTLRQSLLPGRFRLTSYRIPDIEDVALEWASPVVWVMRS
ncbi:MAG: XRE family transcriptional regulator [Myxococcota bacterium]